MTEQNPWDKKNNDLDKVSDFLKKLFNPQKDPPDLDKNEPSRKKFPMKLKNFLIVFLIILAVFSLTKSFYQVQPGEKGLVLRFGEFSKITDSGLNFLFPFIEDVLIVDIETVRKEEFGFRSSTVRQFNNLARSSQTLDTESLMLTGDRNVINLNWVVQYRINDPKDFIFNIRDVRSTVRDVSEMVTRRLVGNRDFDYVLDQREELALETRVEMQNKLDSYSSGVQLVTVQLQDVTPPETVRPSFNEVNEADQDKTRLVNEAQRTYNEQIPKARGEAKRLIEEAEGYAVKRVNEAKGEIARFNSIYNEYRNYQDVTQTRFYIETMKSIIPQVKEVVVIDQNSTIFPLYNLNPTNK